MRITPPDPSLRALGWDDRWEQALTSLGGPDARPARVVRDGRGGAVALGAEGPLRLDVPGLVAGDWVAAGSRGARRLPRRTALVRRAAGAGGPQTLAANVDAVLILCGLDRPLRPRRLHRALAIAHEAGVEPVLVLTKADLHPRPADAAREAAAAAPGIPVRLVGAPPAGPARGLSQIRRHAAGGRTLVMIGESGAGKSTLANLLLGRPALATGPVRPGDARGRHTTTARHLLALPGGGALIDTPGIREIGLWDAGAGLGRAFADIDRLAAGCRFRDCRHEAEPGCAVTAAVAAGRLEPERLRSLADLRRELEAQEMSERERRSRGRRGARMAREAVRAKGRRPR